MPDILPFIPSEPNYRVAVPFGTHTVIFDVRWNARDAAWYLDIRTVDEGAILLGVKVALGVTLGRRSLHPLFTENTFVAYDTSSSGREAKLDDLGTRVLVLRYSAAEMLGAPGA